jgi:hypothetical protein
MYVHITTVLRTIFYGVYVYVDSNGEFGVLRVVYLSICTILFVSTMQWPVVYMLLYVVPHGNQDYPCFIYILTADRRLKQLQRRL